MELKSSIWPLFYLHTNKQNVKLNWFYGTLNWKTKKKRKRKKKKTNWIQKLMENIIGTTEKKKRRNFRYYCYLNGRPSKHTHTFSTRFSFFTPHEFSQWWDQNGLTSFHGVCIVYIGYNCLVFEIGGKKHSTIITTVTIATQCRCTWRIISLKLIV